MAATEAGAQAVRSIEGLYRQHVGAVYRYAYAVLGNHADAEDVTQTTFINALRALERGESPQKPENWLLTIAHNIVRQRWRQLQSRPAEVELDEGASRATPEDEADDTPAMADVVRALQRIPTSQRSALVMRELEGRSYQEIAEILDLTTSALETLLFRARKSLAEELENLVTCDRAELAISQQLDGRISRKERKRLQAHMAECPSCTRMAKTQMRYRGALKGLALLPLPASLTLFKGTSAASAAGLPAIGLGAAGVGVGATAATGGAIGGGATAAGGGALLGGIGAKVAAVVAAAAVAGGVGYTGVKELGGGDSPDRPAPARVNDRTAGAGAGKTAGARSTPTAGGKATGKTGTKAKGTSGASAPDTPKASAGSGSSASGTTAVANGPSDKGAARGSSADAPGQAVAADHRQSGDVGHRAADDRGRSEEARAAAAAKEKTKAKGKVKGSAGAGAATKTKAKGNGSTKAAGSGSSKATAKAPPTTKAKAAPATKGAAAAGAANGGGGADSVKPTTPEKAPPVHEPAPAPDPPAAGVDQPSGGAPADPGKAADTGGPKASTDDPGPTPPAVDGSSSDVAPADAPSPGNSKSPKG